MSDAAARAARMAEKKLVLIDAAPPTFSEDWLALRFSARHKDDLRYVAAWSKWLQWDGTRWAFDRTVNVYDLARAVCREAAKEYGEKGSKRIASAGIRAAVENLARADRRHAATVEDWDRHAWLLTTPGGTVDLRTGDIAPNNPASMITKSSKNREEAFQLLDTLTDTEAKVANAKRAGEMPVRKSALRDPWFQTEEAAEMRGWVEYVGNHGRAMTALLTKGAELNRLINTATQEIVLKNRPVKEALDDAASQWNAIKA